MHPFKASSHQRLALQILCLVFLLAFAVLGGNLYRVQVRETGIHLKSMEQQSIRRIRTAPARGSIYDRFGICLAENRPSHDIVIFPEELRVPGRRARTVKAVVARIEELSAFLGLEHTLTTNDISLHLSRETSLPIEVWTDIGADILARFSENQHRFSGVDVAVSSVRVYPLADLAAHVIGYVRRGDPIRDLEDVEFHFSAPQSRGASGVELQYCELLSGRPGVRMLRTDARGFKYDLLGEIAAEPGHDVTLTIDSRIQETAERMFDGVQGAAVLLDVRNGDVLALASAPSFDINLFAPRISSRDWNRMLNDPHRPLYGRALHGRYVPGSIFKPFLALAALESRIFSGEEIIHCPGFYRIGNRSIRCWQRTGHGSMSMREAMKDSCNVYFIEMGVRIGIEVVNGMARQFGFGSPTGIDLPAEPSGLLPDNAWKRRALRDSWRVGDTVNVAIGQGFVSVTLLQMARATAAIANGGYLYHPRVVAEIDTPGHLERRIHLSKHTLDVVRLGMLDTTVAGTGRSVAIPGVAIAAKTGTAEYGPNNSKRLAWMIAFAPYENPRYAIALVVEDAKEGGGAEAGPRVREILRMALTLDGTIGGT